VPGWRLLPVEAFPSVPSTRTVVCAERHRQDAGVFSQHRRKALQAVGCGVAAVTGIHHQPSPIPLSKLCLQLRCGCFWGIEAVFQHVKGVKSAVSGYSGGTANTAKYELVGRGNTGHAESVEVTYDRSQITYGHLLKIVFAVAHDPTQRNRQGPDVGPQYRSAIFYGGDEQKRIAEAYVAQLQEADVYPRRIVTQIVPLRAFYPAEDYHQDYAAKNPFDIYIMTHDAPKVAHLKTAFPKLYVRR